eukprot:284818417_4
MHGSLAVVENLGLCWQCSRVVVNLAYTLVGRLTMIRGKEMELSLWGDSCSGIDFWDAWDDSGPRELDSEEGSLKCSLVIEGSETTSTLSCASSGWHSRRHCFSCSNFVAVWKSSTRSSSPPGRQNIYDQQTTTQRRVDIRLSDEILIIIRMLVGIRPRTSKRHNRARWLVNETCVASTSYILLLQAVGDFISWKEGEPHSCQCLFCSERDRRDRPNAELYGDSGYIFGKLLRRFEPSTGIGGLAYPEFFIIRFISARVGGLGSFYVVTTSHGIGDVVNDHADTTSWARQEEEDTSYLNLSHCGKEGVCRPSTLHPPGSWYCVQMRLLASVANVLRRRATEECKYRKKRHKREKRKNVPIQVNPTHSGLNSSLSSRAWRAIDCSPANSMSLLSLICMENNKIVMNRFQPLPFVFTDALCCYVLLSCNLHWDVSFLSADYTQRSILKQWRSTVVVTSTNRPRIRCTLLNVVLAHLLLE